MLLNANVTPNEVPHRITKNGHLQKVCPQSMPKGTFSPLLWVGKHMADMYYEGSIEKKKNQSHHRIQQSLSWTCNWIKPSLEKTQVHCSTIIT